jgi:hypothetical protein
MFKLCFFVPPEYAEKVKLAVFKVGAGKMGAYAECSWETLGTGQFRPLQGSKPFIGESNTLERVEELKIEMLCEEYVIKEAVAALKQAHPYEEPAYEVIKLEDF